MHAFAGSLAAASNGVGVYHIYGDETTHDEGFNMQQIPRSEQGLFLKLCGVMGNAYALYEPWSVFTALRRGAVHVGSPGFSGPFFLLAPMNVQPVVLDGCNLLEFPAAFTAAPTAAADPAVFAEATRLARAARRIVVKIGNGARGCGMALVELARRLDAVIVSGPSSLGIVPYSEPRYLSVGGSKGSLCGNAAMNEADLVIVVGARAVCQWDCSGTAWRKARQIINLNLDAQHAGHYNRSLPILGDARANLEAWLRQLEAAGLGPAPADSEWFLACARKRQEWEAFKRARYERPTLEDPVWGREVLTQPAAIRIAVEFADSVGAAKLFDAGDVQANGFQIVEDEREGQTLSETGSSYMGFAASALLSSVLTDRPRYLVAFSGDGAFTMNPQILIDGVEHGVKGCLIVFDNRRMGAITGLQQAQYGHEFRTADAVSVDYVAWASAVRGVKGLFGGYSADALRQTLAEAHSYSGLSLVHVPVYSGPDELGGMGVFGDWNVGNWCERVQAEHHRLGL
jgi:3D-(3,5/4)-trihydroxycyclohexane-1,2-dione acylhydrolase (decyclizing)